MQSAHGGFKHSRLGSKQRDSSEPAAGCGSAPSFPQRSSAGQESLEHLRLTKAAHPLSGHSAACQHPRTLAACSLILQWRNRPVKQESCTPQLRHSYQRWFLIDSESLFPIGKGQTTAQGASQHALHCTSPPRRATSCSLGQLMATTCSHS